MKASEFVREAHAKDPGPIVSTLYAALRTIIPTLPNGQFVTEVVIRCGPFNEIPTMTVTSVILGVEGERHLSFTPVASGIVEHTKRKVEFETRKFKIVPDDNQ